MVETQRLEVVAAVIRDGDRVLVCRRRQGKTAGGKWEFPGGKVEAGETPRSAIVREIREELGVEISVVRQLPTDSTLVGSVLIQLTCFDVELAGPRPTDSHDHDMLVWLHASDLAELDWAAPDLPAVLRLGR